MIDKDREAFETWAKFNGYVIDPSSDRRGFSSEKTTSAFLAWQAARDHYAPKLTDPRALEKALAEEFAKLQPDEDENAWDLMDFAIEAVRFLRPYLGPGEVIDKERFVSEIYEHISAVRYYSRRQMLERVYDALSAKGWTPTVALNATAAHYAPKLTDAEVEQMNKYIAWSPHMPECSIRHGKGEFGCNCGLSLLREQATLRAAGVRFKEEE